MIIWIAVLLITNMQVMIRVKMNGWMTWYFMFCLIGVQSYKDDRRVIMLGCVQWTLVYGWKEFVSSPRPLDQPFWGSTLINSAILNIFSRWKYVCRDTSLFTALTEELACAQFHALLNTVFHSWFAKLHKLLDMFRKIGKYQIYLHEVFNQLYNIFPTLEWPQIS